MNKVQLETTTGPYYLHQFKSGSGVVDPGVEGCDAWLGICDSTLKYNFAKYGPYEDNLGIT